LRINTWRTETTATPIKGFRRKTTHTDPWLAREKVNGEGNKIVAASMGKKSANPKNTGSILNKNLSTCRGRARGRPQQRENDKNPSAKGEAGGSLRMKLLEPSSINSIGNQGKEENEKGMGNGDGLSNRDQAERARCAHKQIKKSKRKTTHTKHNNTLKNHDNKGRQRTPRHQ